MPPLACVEGCQALSFDTLNGSFALDIDKSSANWSPEKSMGLYRINGWGSPYFVINKQGNMAVRPHGSASHSDEIDLVEVLQKIQEGGEMAPPLIIRFPEILRNRIETLQGGFNTAILLRGYMGSFQGVFPIKCNPDRFVVEDIVKFGRSFSFGLEAGSKPELVMAIACMSKLASKNALLICNGYKDAEYMQLALVSRRLGIQSVIVLEEEDELDLVLKTSEILQVQPVIGVRAKLSTKHGGHWGETSGDKGKFGLSSFQLLRVAQKLKKLEMMECLQLLHFHIGSQIPSLSILKEGVSEAAHIYCELSRMGAGMKYLDVGGGLGVDYDGSYSSASKMSVGYTTTEYAEQVVNAVADACAVKNVNPPIICCESGRGLVSHHSVLCFQAMSTSQMPDHSERLSSMEQDLRALFEMESLPQELMALLSKITHLVRVGDFANAVASAKHLKQECARLFKRGLLNLEVRALADRVNEILCHISNPESQITTYNINLSIFKSIPDSWAIGQIFPIVPLQTLDQEPDVQAVLSDLTCDSDGKICSFVGGDAHEKKAAQCLHLHKLQAGRPYYLGMFLGGAYQEILGSMHNLFGSTHVVHILGKAEGSFQIFRELPGQTISNVLRAMQHDPANMTNDLQARVVSALQEGRFKDQTEATATLNIIFSSFSSYTYLAPDRHFSSHTE
ncbi:hypothetical protein O6H91_08G074300 [Diphasiastrum complanatum]|nr:hypothetical protein O6H91_08G074300 [Diphasiastrum complanatum]